VYASDAYKVVFIQSPKASGSDKPNNRTRMNERILLDWWCCRLLDTADWV